MHGSRQGMGLWGKFRSLPAKAQIASWIGLAIVVFVVIGAIGEAVGPAQSASTASSSLGALKDGPRPSLSPERSMRPSSLTASGGQPAPSPSAHPALTDVPITFSNGDFEPIDGFSGPLRLAGLYTITVTALTPGDAQVLLYERTPDCQQIHRIVGGAQGAVLPSDAVTTTKPQPPLADGCYSLYLSASAQVTVTLSR